MTLSSATSAGLVASVGGTRLAREEGILVGTSSGANIHATIQVARGLERGVVVTLLCDHGDKYLREASGEESR